MKSLAGYLLDNRRDLTAEALHEIIYEIDDMVWGDGEYKPQILVTENQNSKEGE